MVEMKKYHQALILCISHNRGNWMEEVRWSGCSRAIIIWQQRNTHRQATSSRPWACSLSLETEKIVFYAIIFLSEETLSWQPITSSLWTGGKIQRSLKQSVRAACCLLRRLCSGGDQWFLELQEGTSCIIWGFRACLKIKGLFSRYTRSKTVCPEALHHPHQVCPGTWVACARFPGGRQVVWSPAGGTKLGSCGQD